MIKKFNGHLALPSGKLIVCQGEIDENPAPIDEEDAEQTRQALRELTKKTLRDMVSVALEVSLAEEHGIHRHMPTGPVVDSTLAEKDEVSKE